MGEADAGSTQVIRTDQVPQADRFDFYRQLIRTMPVPLVVEPEAPRRPPVDFRATIEQTVFGEVAFTTLATWQTTPFTVLRTDRLIRSCDPGVLRLVVNLQGCSTFTQAGNDAELGVGDLALFDTSMPFAGRRGLLRYGGPDRLLMVTFPRTKFNRPDMLRPVLSRRIPSSAGIARLLRVLLLQLCADAASFGAAQRLDLATTTLDLVTMLANDVLQSDLADAETLRRGQLLRIQESVRAHLGQPTLSPKDIAVANHMSLRSLQRLFRDHGLTVSGWIRHERLRRCRRDLADPTLLTVPVSAVGRRWGFPDPTQFSHAFRAAYAISPAAYRAAMSTDALEAAAMSPGTTPVHD